MTTKDFIADLFCRVDDRMKNVPNHSQAALWPSEVVTIGLLFAITSESLFFAIPEMGSHPISGAKN